MKVLKKQANSKDCIICGINNNSGLKAQFYEMEDGTVETITSFKSIHQSYPERVHGGMITALLDEIIGRAVWTIEPSTWGVTIDLNIKYRKPVPYDTLLRVIGKVVSNSKRTFVGSGMIYDMDYNLLAEATATYFKAPLSKIASEKYHSDITIYVPDEVTEL